MAIVFLSRLHLKRAGGGMGILRWAQDKSSCLWIPRAGRPCHVSQGQKASFCPTTKEVTLAAD